MSRFKLRRPSPALVISVIALFVALGGSAVAATAITSKKDVNKKGNLTKGAVEAKNLKGGNKAAVTTKKLREGAVTSSKLAPGAVSDLIAVTKVTSQPTNVPANTTGTATATCPPSTVAVGGGYDTGLKDPANGAAVGLESRPTDNGWQASVWAVNLNNTLTAHVVCVDDTTTN